MGFFKRVGRQVEQFKQTATDTAAKESDYQCEACEARFHTMHEQCPECGGESIVSIHLEE